MEEDQRLVGVDVHFWLDNEKVLMSTRTGKGATFIRGLVQSCVARIEPRPDGIIDIRLDVLCLPHVLRHAIGCGVKMHINMPRDYQPHPDFPEWVRSRLVNPLQERTWNEGIVKAADEIDQIVREKEGQQD